MPTARGWDAGRTPVAAPGLKVNALATGLKHPRWLHVLPNGDVLVAEALMPAPPVKSIFDFAMVTTMKRAAAVGVSPDRITLLRDADNDGVAEVRERYLEGLNQPFGMALVGDTFYVGNTDGVVAFDYAPGATRCRARAQARLVQARRALDAEPAGEPGRRVDLHRRRFGQQYRRTGPSGRGRSGGDLSSGSRQRAQRIFASGLRNPVGLAWEPTTSALWTVVNERDGLGDETPPDYLTSVQAGGFYGWPFCYWGRRSTTGFRRMPAMVAKAIQPDYALGGHTASLGLCWMPAGTLPGFPDGMVIGQHGSWNRSTLSGYKVVFVPFENGRPSGPPRDILSGFLAPDETESYGRPVGVAIGADSSLLVADDVGDVIWRVTAR